MSNFKNVIVILFVVLLFSDIKSFGQSRQGIFDKKVIKSSVFGFLEWYKKKLSDTTQNNYLLAKGGYPDTTTSRRIDFSGVEKYLEELRKSGYLSENYLCGLQGYFKDIDDTLLKMDTKKDLIPVSGLDVDFILRTGEPESILNQLNKAKILKIYVAYDKSIVKLKISTIGMLFTLSRFGTVWKIDYVGYYKYRE